MPRRKVCLNGGPATSTQRTWNFLVEAARQLPATHCKSLRSSASPRLRGPSRVCFVPGDHGSGLAAPKPRSGAGGGGRVSPACPAQAGVEGSAHEETVQDRGVAGRGAGGAGRARFRGMRRHVWPVWHVHHRSRYDDAHVHRARAVCDRWPDAGAGDVCVSSIQHERAVHAEPCARTRLAGSHHALPGRHSPRRWSGSWPHGRDGAGELEDRDVHFFDGMLAWLRANHCIDDRRVFVMGYSNGAALSYVLACERAGAIAGIGIASGRPTCAPAVAKPIIISHGTRDQTIGYEQAIQAVQMWSERNGCAAPEGRCGGLCCRRRMHVCADDAVHVSGRTRIQHRRSRSRSWSSSERFRPRRRGGPSGPPVLRQLDDDDADVVRRRVERQQILLIAVQDLAAPSDASPPARVLRGVPGNTVRSPRECSTRPSVCSSRMSPAPISHHSFISYRSLNPSMLSPSALRSIACERRQHAERRERHAQIATRPP